MGPGCDQPKCEYGPTSGVCRVPTSATRNPMTAVSPTGTQSWNGARAASTITGTSVRSTTTGSADHLPFRRRMPRLCHGRPTDPEAREHPRPPWRQARRSRADNGAMALLVHPDLVEPVTGALLG